MIYWTPAGSFTLLLARQARLMLTFAKLKMQFSQRWVYLKMPLFIQHPPYGAVPLYFAIHSEKSLHL